MIHDTAARGFARGAWDYERGRPGYPPDAIAFVVEELDVGAGSNVVELGAGTGKFTRLLVPTGARILAVEPVREMREVFASVVPDVEIVDGRAEAIPAGDGSADVVAAAQTFHWVDVEPALAEVHRVLKPGGGVAFLWNSRAGTSWEARVTALMDRVAGTAPRYGSAYERWEDLLRDHDGFGELRREQFRHDHLTNRDATLARVASTSYVSAMADAEREAVLDEVRAILDDEGVGEQFVEPYVTDVYVCRKR